MTRSRLTLLHGASGALALGVILCFFSLALYAELLASTAGVIAIRQVILYVIPVLVLALAAAGASGARLAGRSKAAIVVAKSRRMRVAAINGLCVLIPAAVFLGLRAQSGDLSGIFGAVQLLELAAGALNITMLGLNMRDGLRLRARKAAARA